MLHSVCLTSDLTTSNALHKGRRRFRRVMQRLLGSFARRSSLMMRVRVEPRRTSIVDRRAGRVATTLSGIRPIAARRSGVRRAGGPVVQPGPPPPSRSSLSPARAPRSRPTRPTRTRTRSASSRAASGCGRSRSSTSRDQLIAALHDAGGADGLSRSTRSSASASVTRSPCRTSTCSPRYPTRRPSSAWARTTWSTWARWTRTGISRRSRRAPHHFHQGAHRGDRTGRGHRVSPERHRPGGLRRARGGYRQGWQGHRRGGRV